MSLFQADKQKHITSIKTSLYGIKEIQKMLPYFSIFIGMLALSFIIIAITTRELRFFILSASLLLTFIVGTLFITHRIETSEARKYLTFIFLLEISIVLIAVVFPSYSGIPYAVIALAVSLLISASMSNRSTADWVITIGIVNAISAIQLSTLAPLPQTIHPIIAITALIIAVLLSFLVIYLVIRRQLLFSLRIKLILGSLILILIPLAVLSIINNRYLQNAIQEQSNQSLTVASEQTALSIDTFIQNRLSSLENESSLPSISAYITLSPSHRNNSIETIELGTSFRSLQTKEKVYLPSYAILDLNGQNIYDTETANINTSEKMTSYFQKCSLAGTGVVSPVEFYPGSREGYLNFINPIRNEKAQTIGYIRARYDARILQNIIEKNVGLIGTRSYPILVDENGVRLADGYSPNQIYRALVSLSSENYEKLRNANRLPAFISAENKTNLIPGIAQVYAQETTSKYFTVPLVVQGQEILHSGTITHLTSQPWDVIYLQDRAVLDASLKSQNLLSSTISTLLAGLAGILITIVANLFSAPIQRLTKAAEQVSQGNLDVRAGIKSNDEIGVLGNSFDLMTEQLKDFIDDLENRVSERTNKLAQQNDSLQFKTRQLRTVSDVARSIVSTREVDTLLSTVANLISERFDFYHVGIFLLDEIGDYAILRAANSAGGQNMLARKHRLKVGQEGIVGYVTGTGEPRIATDVGEDSVYFNNPDLPYTKSEMALPLKLGDKVIGALDVQSTGSNAFYMEDVELFSTLADQLAIAIYNNQLYEASNKALEETQRLYNEYLRQEWSRRNLDSGKKNFKYTIEGLIPFEEDLPEINMVLNSARPVFRSVKATNGSEEIKSVMAVPIILNEEPIGAIYLQENSTNDYVWSQNELFTVQAVADQVALTLENARLFEQTVRRADRERKVLEITSKIRSTNDPQEMLKITLEELRQNLGVQQAQIILSVKNNGLPVIKTGEKTNQVKLHPEESTGAL